jgi:ankyrin repeat protein
MSDPASRLPARPSLEQLRKQAKDLLHLVRAGDTAAVQRIRAVIPTVGTTGSPAEAILADAQFVVAREYGFENWAALTQYVDAVSPAARGPTTRQLIRPVEMERSLTLRLPDGGSAPADTVWSMFTATLDGDVPRVKTLVERHPGLARYEQNYTPPIHFAVREGHTELVRFLLDCGADPAAYKSYPFQESLLTFAEDRGHTEVARVLREHLARRFAVADGTSAIIAAARAGDLAGVRSELARNPELARAANENGETALHHAANGGHVDVVLALLEAGAQVDAVSGDGSRPVHCALEPRGRVSVARERRMTVADTLLAHGARYTIYVAAVRGDSEFVRNALNRDSSLANFEDTCHRRPLSAAASRNDLEMVRLLLSHGADPNLPEEGAPRGHALWTAVYHDRREMARLLVEHGADPNAMVESSGTPMMHARKVPELFQLLVAHGGDEKPGDEQRLERLIDDGDLAEVERLLQRRPDLIRNQHAFWSEGILTGPASKPNREMADLLLRLGARVPTVTKWGPYYYFKHYEMAEYLLKRGMDANHMNWHRFTVLHHVSAEGDVAKARLLLDHGAAIDAIDEEYQSTPLGVAARWGRREVAALLLARGADPNASGAGWSTPLAWARKKGHADIETALRDAGATT